MDALREIRNILREYFSDSKKIVLWIVIASVLLALWIRPKVEDYLELREMKAQYEELVDVAKWPAETKIRINNHNVEEADAARVLAAVAKLQFDGRFDEDRWVDLHWIQDTGMKDDGGRFHIVGKTFAWSLEVSADGSYVYQTRERFAMTNGQELQQVLADLQAKYPYQPNYQPYW